MVSLVLISSFTSSYCIIPSAGFQFGVLEVKKAVALPCEERARLVRNPMRAKGANIRAENRTRDLQCVRLT
jgi:hypothetical protein